MEHPRFLDDSLADMTRIVAHWSLVPLAAAICVVLGVKYGARLKEEYERVTRENDNHSKKLWEKEMRLRLYRLRIAMDREQILDLKSKRPIKEHVVVAEEAINNAERHIEVARTDLGKGVTRTAVVRTSSLHDDTKRVDQDSTLPTTVTSTTKSRLEGDGAEDTKKEPFIVCQHALCPGRGASTTGVDLEGGGGLARKRGHSCCKRRV